MITKYPTHYSMHFTEEELQEIHKAGEKNGFIAAKVQLKGKEVVNHNKRKTSISWIQPEGENLWLFSKAAQLLKTAPINTLQAFQYSVYYDGGHYKWHRDVGKEGDIVSQRIISGILQLSHPDDYKGGDLKIDTGDTIVTAPKEYGLTTVFPAGWKHKVYPVTSGIRKTLVMWGLR